MESSTLSQLISSGIDALKNHMSNYLGSELPEIIDGEFTADDNIVYKCSVPSLWFLNNQCDIDAYLIKSETDSNFICCIIPSQTENQPFSGYIPEMIYTDPWGIQADGETLPFPNLASLQVSNLNWLYVYFSNDETDGKTTGDKAKNQLWDLFKTQLTDGSLKTKDLSFNNLKTISKDNAELNLNSNCDGGLFYFGEFPEFPFKDVVTSEMKELAEWSILKKNIQVQGCIYQKDIFNYLKLQLPIIKWDKPFGEDIIKTIEITAELSSLLVAPSPDSWNIDFYNADDDSANTPTINQDRSLSIIGRIIFKNNNEFDIFGTWPLDGDLILIKAGCKLQHLGSYFDHSFIEGVNFPDTISSAVQFTISKETKSLEKIDFEIAITEWVLLDNLFAIATADLKVGIHHPGDINIILASFTGKLKIGRSIYVLVSGNYPEGNFSVALDPSTPILLNDMIEVFQEGGIGIADNLAITELSGYYSHGIGYTAFNLSVSQSTDWKAGDIGFNLKNISIHVYGVSGSYIFKLNATFTYTFKHNQLKNKAPLLFSGGAEYDNGWSFNASYSGNVSLLDIGKEFGFSDIPNELNKFTFKELSFFFDSTSGQKYFNGNFTINLFNTSVDLALEVNKTKDTTSFSGDFSTDFNGKEASFKIDFVKSETDYDLQLKLLFTVAGTTVLLDAHKEVKSDSTNKKGISEFTFSGGTQGLNIHITDLLKDLVEGEDLAKFIPTNILPDIELEDIYVHYNAAEKETNLIAIALIEGQEMNVFFQYKGKSETNKNSIYAFGVCTDFDNFTDLPLVGNEMDGVAINGLGFTYTSLPGIFKLPILSEAASSTVREIKFPKEPKSFEKKFNLTGDLTVPQLSRPISLMFEMKTRGADKSKKIDPTPTSTSTNENVKKENAKLKQSSESGIIFDLNKKAGPVTLDKIGFDLNGIRLEVTIVGAFSLAGFSLTLEGLGLSFLPFKLLNGDNIEPKFLLSGLGLEFSNPPVSINGLFCKEKPKTGEKLSFAGAAQISTASFSFSALGSYIKMDDGNDSLFVYGAYLNPIGGPSFCFVTGISAGFGYNRKLILPDPLTITSHPLISPMVSTGDESPIDISSFNEYIQPELGSVWGAFGVRIESFKMIESFLLLALNFGSEFEIDILGVSTMTFPAPIDGVASKAPIAKISIGIVARILPERGVVAINGAFLPGSYIFSPDAIVTGGFALLNIFKDQNGGSWDGAKEGEFIVTLGGYHPSYKHPSYYPKVSRIEMNWKVSDHLYVKSSAYFAITPDALMVGGDMSVDFSAGGTFSIEVHFTMSADFIMYWKPFYYLGSAHANLNVKASINVDLWLFSIHESVEFDLSADLRIWGPDFSGYASVSVHVLVSFSVGISFGESERPIKPISKDEFVKGLLPEEDKIVSLNISNGLIASQSNPSYQVVNAKELTIICATAIPIKKLTGIPTKNLTINNSFGIKPMANLDEDFNSEFSVEIKKDGNSISPEDLAHYKFELITKNMPAALWQKAKVGGAIPETRGESLINDLLSGVKITLDLPLDGPSITIHEDEKDLLVTAPASFVSPFSYKESFNRV